MGEKTVQERLRALEKTVDKLGEGGVEAHLRLGAAEAVLFGLALGFVNNIKAKTVTPAENAQLFMDAVMQYSGHSDDGGIGSEQLELLREFAERLQAYARPGATGTRGPVN
ncbi:hypothetical protein [Caulobacter hibisci]|uniref:Uncharacterized protein n=1 Tax=Caulobacter hibisci TaxID=2035993 RepID=A0ABS0SYD0_9CAUL|nr:hypothetical protein [Caulobacter hibisci]MBI1684441.1 hypothetical protein [Caulobacter hibisci]